MCEGEEHRSYVELCRALGLEWTWRPGDWYWSDSFGEVTMVETWPDGQPDGHARDPIPLPLSHQLDTMLEEAGVLNVALHSEGPAGWSCQQAPYDVSEDWMAYPSSPLAPSREEAKLRLWMAVTGREVPDA